MWKEYDLYTLLGTQTSKLVELLSKGGCRTNFYLVRQPRFYH